MQIRKKSTHLGGASLPYLAVAIFLTACGSEPEGVQGTYAYLAPEEASRADFARSIEDPRQRLQALAELADIMTRERAFADGLVDGEGAPLPGVDPATISDRYSQIRHDLLREETEAVAEVAERVAREALPPVVTHAEREEGERSLLRYAEDEVRSANLPREEEERLLGMLQETFRHTDRQDVTPTEEELNPSFDEVNEAQEETP